MSLTPELGYREWGIKALNEQATDTPILDFLHSSREETLVFLNRVPVQSFILTWGTGLFSQKFWMDT